MNNEISPNERGNNPDKGSKLEKKEMKRLPKVDEELHARTIFESVAAESRPAKTKPKTRSKLKWKEHVDLKGKIVESKDSKSEESKDSSTKSTKAIRLHISSNREESDEAKRVIAKEKLGMSEIASTDDELQQSILWLITRTIVEEILIWLIIIIVLISKRIHR
ncbi:unnamed protein product [Litomosoides sigmodontis]|uniref:Uncharacterized protein n=1 Tax=Litomosoides sigmodontis TaxID=42156 RepID=A0A3P6V297_LITSI|nr:unnamed protein product [Litomosoides sigmodontis]